MVKNRQSNKGGFRLQYAEIFNWGTFDQHIWRLQPGMKNSLLTGANGSGKTTLADAIITLLVPPNKRHYNQSSGAEKKRERDERSYTLGAYSSVQSENGLAANTKYLRKKDEAYSILIGVFHNNFSGEYLTLAQVRWFANNALKRAYFVSRQPLEIATHFTPMDASGYWKRRLRKMTKTEEFDSFSKYSRYFSKIFGLKSDKALSLFSQTVGIKVLGNLNEFIRANMLEEMNTEEEFLKLREHYENLLSAYQSIERAREQLRLLQPIISESEKYRVFERETAAVEKVEKNIAPYFSSQKARVYKTAARSLEIDLKRKENQIAKARESLNALQEKRLNLQVAISNNKVYEQIRNLDKQIQVLQKEEAGRRKRAGRYNQIAERLDLKIDPNERQFYRGLEQLQKELDRIHQRLEDVQQNHVQLRIELGRLEDEKKQQTELVRSLQKRRNRLPLEQVRIREALLQKLGLPEKELPFAAELLRVKEEEKVWTPYVEQILRSLGLSLLVKDEYYPQVLEWAHRNQLNGKIRFYKVQENASLEPAKIKGGLLEKIEIKQKRIFAAWLGRHLHLNYNFAAVDGYAAIARYERSLNNRGLIKNKDLYERDDKAKRLEEAYHILGWDNQSSIIFHQRRLRQTEEEIKEWNRAIAQRKAEMQALNEQRDDLNRLKEFVEFSEIDWKSALKGVAQYQKEKAILLKSSDQLKALESQLEQVSATIEKEEQQRDRLFEQKGKLQNRLENYQRVLAEAIQFLTQYGDFPVEELEAEMAAYIQSSELSLSNIASEESRLRRKIRASLDEKRSLLSKSEKTIEKAMQKFINPSLEILEKHPSWTIETSDLQAELSYLKEYERIYKKITEEDLPKFRKRFKDWLNERLIFDIANFKTALENQEALILDSIQTINKSLRNIDFNENPLTYIQLDVHKTRDQAVREFKQMLRQAMPDPGKLVQGDEKELEASFKRIKRIIEELSANELWRKKVTDVRNWLEFGAIERFRADDVERQYYVDSQSLSGGEKAKLAYTILASAIAYQFGIRSDNSRRRSFCFAVVDEAFSKVDPANAIYAMELFQQLNLQLMVVTPLDKINLAEPYIHTVHYVQNKAKKNSEIFDVPMEAYQLRKEAFQEEIR